MGDVGQAVRALENELSRAGDAHVASRLAGVLLEDRVDLRRDVARVQRQLCAPSARRQKRQRAETRKDGTLHHHSPADGFRTRHRVFPQAACVSSSSSSGSSVVFFTSSSTARESRPLTPENLENLSRTSTRNASMSLVTTMRT